MKKLTKCEEIGVCEAYFASKGAMNPCPPKKNFVESGCTAEEADEIIHGWKLFDEQQVTSEELPGIIKRADVHREVIQARKPAK